MATAINFILAAALLNAAIWLQLKDYKKQGRNAKLFSAQPLGLLANALYTFALGFFSVVAFDLAEKGYIPYLFTGESVLNTLLSILLLLFFCVLLPMQYAYGLHQARLTQVEE
jgi:hypothetical protein